MHDAMLWEPLEENKVHCLLCRHNCRINDGRRGICNVRENVGGRLYSLVYDKVIARNVDPIEKKPLFHFLPGSHSYSIATPGCNFHCLFCQNAEIAQMPRDSKVIMGESVKPEDIVIDAQGSGCGSISYTYTEPTIFFELAYDTAQIARDRGLKNVFVTNGYISKEALAVIKPCLDAANIDLKSFNPEFYKKICGSELENVLDSIRAYHEAGIWIELTTLIIPDHNDSPKELRDIAHFIASIDKDIPWHVTRFHPTYRLRDKPPTPLETLEEASIIGRDEGLKYVYEGNVPGRGGEDTICPSCGSMMIKRYGNSVLEDNTIKGACRACGEKLPGIF